MSSYSSSVKAWLNWPCVHTGLAINVAIWADLCHFDVTSGV